MSTESAVGCLRCVLLNMHGYRRKRQNGNAYAERGIWIQLVVANVFDINIVLLSIFPNPKSHHIIFVN